MSGKRPNEPAPASAPLDLAALPLTDNERTQLAAWCDEVLALRAVEKSFKHDADKRMSDDVVPLLERLALTTSVAAPTFSLVRSKGRASLKAELLLMHGVPMATIEKCKVTGEPSWSLRAKGDKPTNESTEGANNAS